MLLLLPDAQSGGEADHSAFGGGQPGQKGSGKVRVRPEFGVGYTETGSARPMSHMTAPEAPSCVRARPREAVCCLLDLVSFTPRVALGGLRRALGP